MKLPWMFIVRKMDRTRYERLLILILAAAVMIRIPMAFYMGNQVTALPGIQDQVTYDALAHSLLDGRGYSFTQNWYPFTRANTPTAHWSFVYPLYLAGVYSLTGYHPLVARLVQGIVAGLLISLLVYRIGRRVADESTGLVGAGLAAVYGYFIYYNVALMTETFFIVLVLLALHLSLGIKEKPVLWRWILLGLTLGTAGLLRQTVVLFVPFLLLWLWLELRNAAVPRWHLTIPVVVIILMIAPWTIRNYRVYQQFLLLNSNAGYALYASNNPNLGSDWNNDEVVVPVPRELRGLNEAQLDRALTQKGIGFIVADPQRYLLLTLDKTLEYFKFWPTSESGTMSNLVRVLSFGLYLPLMLVGLFLSLSRWRNFAVLYLFMLIHTGIHLLSWPAPRYRLSVDAVAMVFAALAVLEIAKRADAWRRRPSLINNSVSDKVRS
jgi:4-amino-4-deoxy-L-arabinose transferase-like glycosyltransferase